MRFRLSHVGPAAPPRGAARGCHNGSVATLRDLGILIGAFVAASAIAAAAGAANLGTALTFGTIAFAAALMFVLLRH